MDDTLIEAPKIITGAIYERARNGETEQAQCIARITESGRVFGLFRRFGLSFERIQESSEEMMSWKLLWAPSHEEAPKQTTVAAQKAQKVSERTGKPTRKYNKRTKKAE